MTDETATNDFETDRPAPSMGGLAPIVQASADDKKLVDLIDKLLIIQPLTDEIWETATSPETPVLVSYMIEFTYAMNSNNVPVVEWEDLGEVPVFWTFVKTQLREKSTPDTPWVVGRLKKGRRAYLLDPPIPEDIRAADQVLAEWVATKNGLGDLI